MRDRRVVGELECALVAVGLLVAGLALLDFGGRFARYGVACMAGAGVCIVIGRILELSRREPPRS